MLIEALTMNYAGSYHSSVWFSIQAKITGLIFVWNWWIYQLLWNDLHVTLITCTWKKWVHVYLSVQGLGGICCLTDNAYTEHNHNRHHALEQTLFSLHESFRYAWTKYNYYMHSLMTVYIFHSLFCLWFFLW